MTKRRPRLMEENGLHISSWDTPIYRVFKLKRFKDLLTSRMNGLVSPFMWDDPFENLLLRCKVRDPTGELGSLEPIASGWYGQCWTLNRDSDAMWRIYSPEKTGVRAATTIKKLFSSIWNPSDKYRHLKYFIGIVQYLDRAKIEQFLATTSFTNLAVGGQTHNFAETLCMKRKEFEHEKEVRILTYDAEGNMGEKGVLNFPFDHQKILDGVTLDPRLLAPDFERIRMELKDSGCMLPIDQSELYKINNTIIRL